MNKCAGGAGDREVCGGPANTPAQALARGGEGQGRSGRDATDDNHEAERRRQVHGAGPRPMVVTKVGSMFASVEIPQLLGGSSDAKS
jgi:hypothetical protein